MLKQIICDKFVQQRVVFHKGLNVIAGDEIASNSIGKSTMLMIIDFVFGGDDYVKKNYDAVENLGHHVFKFSFIFDEDEYFFYRTTAEYKFVTVCNKKFEAQNTIKIDEYTNLLQERYGCQIEELSFRSIVGRYFRIYLKENLNERKPIQYFEKERQKDSIVALVKLFNKYKEIVGFEKHITELSEEKNVLAAAAKKELVPNINKTLFGQNQKSIEALNIELTKLKESIVSAALDIEALVSKDILDLKKKKSSLVTQRNIFESRLKRTLTNIENKNLNAGSELEQLIEYFPNFNIERVKMVDNFHASITSILKEELKSTAKEINTKLSILNNEIADIDKLVIEKLSIKNAPKYTIEKVVEVASKIKQLTDENGFYTKKKNIETSLKTAKENLDTYKEAILAEICSQINIQMSTLNKLIYSDNRRAPILTIQGDKYSFNTFGDTGTGTAFANLITFDLALLELTCLPALVHDLPLLKNIENIALENIVEIYNKNKKQIFIAIDKVNSYKKETGKIISDRTVLQLTENKILFIKNWKNNL
ncbi:DUF2326 domain-containing protein [Paenibacillus sp. PSB04]|uniref:DUF2326 domain-containing protein n=1 Tax=Paenibacillus sp. PSB04 TaxID=2866810 RepID=UPI0021F241CE|nr:DUF2326 domain-containing protein [Paenibacillus sp. PSB04]UYO06431.1 DUF2326 domain-containing protein [Paenibacillus sp. PSB04]